MRIAIWSQNTTQAGKQYHLTEDQEGRLDDGADALEVSADFDLYEGSETELLEQAENMIANAENNSNGAYRRKCANTIKSIIS